MNTLSENDYVDLYSVSDTSAQRDALSKALNRHGSGWLTVCPECQLDSFNHSPSCRLRNCDSGLYEPLPADQASKPVKRAV
jgi:hypothetical protein